jgi:hypothetical protein
MLPLSEKKMEVDMNTTVRDPPDTMGNERLAAGNRLPVQATIAAKNIMTRNVITAGLHPPTRDRPPDERASVRSGTDHQ